MQYALSPWRWKKELKFNSNSPLLCLSAVCVGQELCLVSPSVTISCFSVVRINSVHLTIACVLSLLTRTEQEGYTEKMCAKRLKNLTVDAAMCKDRRHVRWRGCGWRWRQQQWAGEEQPEMQADWQGKCSTTGKQVITLGSYRGFEVMEVTLALLHVELSTGQAGPVCRAVSGSGLKSRGLAWVVIFRP